MKITKRREVKEIEAPLGGGLIDVLNGILLIGLKKFAKEIRIMPPADPNGKGCCVMFNTGDAIWHLLAHFDHRLFAMVMGRLKILCGLNIAEHGLTQAGQLFTYPLVDEKKLVNMSLKLQVVVIISRAGYEEVRILIESAKPN